MDITEKDNEFLTKEVTEEDIIYDVTVEDNEFLTNKSEKKKFFML